MEYDPYADALICRDKKSQLLQAYLDTVQTSEYDEAGADNAVSYDISRQLYITDKPLHKTVVIIPVAAESEQTTVGHAIDEYGRQEPREPFTLVLGLNADVDLGSKNGVRSPESHQTIQNLEAAKVRNPHLDIRTAETEYHSPTIGAIRRDLWNGVLRTYQRYGISDTREMVGINHDIDVLHIPQHYIAAIQKRYENPIRAVGPAYAQTRHGWDASHPNSSKAVFWTDYYAGAANSGYEAGAVIPMTYYASRGGFDASKRTHEVGSMLANVACKKLIPTGRLITSPRRFIGRLPEAGPNAIWTTDTFGTSDPYRSPDYIADVQDMDNEALYERLGDAVIHDIPILITKQTEELLQTWDSVGIFDTAGSTADMSRLIYAATTDRMMKSMLLSHRVMKLCEPTTPTGWSDYVVSRDYVKRIFMIVEGLSARKIAEKKMQQASKLFTEYTD